MNLKLCNLDAETVKVDLETLQWMLAHATSLSKTEITRCMGEMDRLDGSTHHRAFWAEKLEEESKFLKHTADLHHAFCEMDTRDNLVVVTKDGTIYKSCKEKVCS